MAGNSTTLTTLRDRLVTVISGVVGLKVYGYMPVQFDAVPVAALDLPQLRRVGVDEPENELGSVTWTTRWPLALLCDGQDPVFANTQSLEWLAALTAVLDASETLENLGNALARLVDAEPEEGRLVGDGRPVVGFRCVIEVQQLV